MGSVNCKKVPVEIDNIRYGANQIMEFTLTGYNENNLKLVK
jgi:hypothetical protein